MLQKATTGRSGGLLFWLSQETQYISETVPALARKSKNQVERPLVDLNRSGKYPNVLPVPQTRIEPREVGICPFVRRRVYKGRRCTCVSVLLPDRTDVSPNRKLTPLVVGIIALDRRNAGGLPVV